MGEKVTNQKLILLAELNADFPLFASACLSIRTKSGTIAPLILNTAQLYVHEQVQSQLSKTGRIRALVLKGRQQGISTYVEGRFYWRTSLSFGKRAYVLAHEQAASDNLFDMAKRYHEHCPESIRPRTNAANAKELSFSTLGGGYKVATAGSKATGRSGTAQYLHASEAGFWPSAEEHMAGIGQTVPNEPGTEIFIESTANGMGNMFHKLWQLAERGESDYIAIFVPWFWQPEYRAEVPADFMLDDEEALIQSAYALDDAQMAWRRSKINTDFQGDVSLFRQEYPCTAAEAFRSTGGEPLIQPAHVMAARAFVVDQPFGALVVGVDPARFGEDRTAIAWRKGRKCLKIDSHHKIDTMEIAGRVAMIIDQDKPAQVFIDVGGLGAGVVDRLNELNYGHIVTAVNFGGTSINPDAYINMRAQMWGEMRDWIKSGTVDIPDDDVLHADMVGPGYGYDSRQRLKIETKEDMKKRGIKSPDKADALALTFAYPVANTADKELPAWMSRLRSLRTGNNHTSPMAQ